MTRLLQKTGMDARNYDIANGVDANDLADTTVYEAIVRDVLAGEHVGGFASPDCSSFSKVRSMPGGPQPVRGPHGRDRYGYKNKKGARSYKDGTPLSPEEAAHAGIGSGRRDSQLVA